MALSPIILQQHFLPQLSPLHAIPSLKCQSPSSSSNGFLPFPSPPSISPAIPHQQSASFANRLRPLLNSLLHGFQAIPVRMKVVKSAISIYLFRHLLIQILMDRALELLPREEEAECLFANCGWTMADFRRGYHQNVSPLVYHIKCHFITFQFQKIL